MEHNENVVFPKRLFLLLSLIFFGIFLGLLAFYHNNIYWKIESKLLSLNPPPLDTRQPTEVNISGKIKVKYPQNYTIVLLGDSMTEKLGNCTELKEYLDGYIPNKTFQILNYGYGSTDILSVQDRLEKTTYHGRSFRPIDNIAYNLILIESFGNNPLSQFPLAVGLQKQTETLDKIVATIKAENPVAKIAFVATIAPNRVHYAQGLVNLSPEKRAKWADERIAYIKNHINYAQSHHIPLIDIFDKSLDGSQGGNLEYINTADYIHPSSDGVYFISQQIAKQIYEQKLLTP